MAQVNDSYKQAFDRCRGGSASLNDQQWVQFLDLLVDANFLSDELAQRFRQEHEAETHSFELFQRDLCAWVDPFNVNLRVDGVIQELQTKTKFLRHVLSQQHDPDVINASFLHSVIAQEEELREKLRGVEKAASDALTTQWLDFDLLGPGDQPSGHQHPCPWKFQLANARNLRVEDRQRARHQLRLHQCDEDTDRVLKKTFYPALQQFREVQVGMATLTARHGRSGDGSDEGDPELAVVLLVRSESASEEALAWLDNLVSAYRQLSLSPYVQQYLGSEDVTASKQESSHAGGPTTRHFFEFVQARSLADMLVEDGVILETSPLFKRFARELLLALVDLQEQSTHHLHTRLLPEHVMISHSGRRLFLVKLDFGDYVDPFQSSLSTVVQRRERELFQDLAVVLFSMLYPISLPQNLAAFRTQYLGRRDSVFVFKYRIRCKPRVEEAHANVISVACGDKFALLLSKSGHQDTIWNCRLSTDSALRCTGRRYSPMEFFFVAKAKGECIVSFSSLTRGVATSVPVLVKICADNFRLHSSRAQTLVTYCASEKSHDQPASLPSLRLLLDQHEYFQPLSESESHQAEKEQLERSY